MLVSYHEIDCDSVAFALGLDKKLQLLERRSDLRSEISQYYENMKYEIH